MTNICPICESENKKSAVYKVKNIWQSDKDVYICENCGLYYIIPPTEKEIESFYRSSFYSENKNKIICFLKEKMYIAKILSQFFYIKDFIKNKPISDIAEIGSYKGRLLNLFKKRGHNVFGFELNKSLRDITKDKYSIQSEEDFFAEDIENKFDVVILSHTLEHFTNIEEKLKKIKNSMKKEGILFIEVPNIPHLKIINENDLKLYLNTEHTFNFNSKNIKLLLEKFGFSIIDTKFINYNANYNLRKSIWLGVFDSPLNIFYYLFYVIKIILLKKFAFTETSISMSEKDKLSYGENIRIIAKEHKRNSD